MWPGAHMLAGAAAGRASVCVIVARKGRGCAMAEKDFELPVTLRQIIREEREYSIFLLEGGELIFFPA